MALFWVNVYNREVLTGQQGEERFLTSVSIAARLRRVVLQGYIDISTSTSDVVNQWIRHGVLSLIQVTHGEFAPPPEPIRTDATVGRDIVYSSFHSVGNPNILLNRYQVPPPGQMIDVDVEVSRGDGIEPLNVYWVWGLPNTSVAGVAVGFSRFWARLLLEDEA